MKIIQTGDQVCKPYFGGWLKPGSGECSGAKSKMWLIIWKQDLVSKCNQIWMSKTISWRVSSFDSVFNQFCGLHSSLKNVQPTASI